MRVLKDIPELVKQLEDIEGRTWDTLESSCDLDLEEATSEDTVLITGPRVGRIPLQSQAHGQLAGKLNIPKRYYDKMLEEDRRLLCTNVNAWLGKEDKNYLVRCIDRTVRAFLSNKYRPIQNLSVVKVATAAAIVNLKGAKCFAWSVHPTKMDLCFVHPGIVVDLNNLDAGIQSGLVENVRGEGGGTAFCYPGTIDTHDKAIYSWGERPKPPEGTHPVFPACRITNSETGHGGLRVMIGLYEAVCDNTCFMGINLANRHIGKVIEMDDLLTAETYQKANELIFARIKDMMVSAFDTDRLLTLAAKFKGLQGKIVDLHRVEDNIVAVDGFTDELWKDVLAAYKADGIEAAPDVDTMWDVHRALTHVAVDKHNDGHDATGYLLEETAGTILA